MSQEPVVNKWVKDLPVSRPVYPDNTVDKLKYFFWRVITPFHPHVRDVLCYMQILRARGRQNYLLGKLAPNHSVETVVEYLLDKGFGNHFIALEDEGQVVSLRYTPDFKHQYHIRIFNDREVRGHFEYTPEYRPIGHMVHDDGVESRFEEFLELLRGYIVPASFSNKSNFRWSFMGGTERTFPLSD